MNKFLFFIGMALILIPFGIRFAVSGNQRNLVTTYEGQWEKIDQNEMEACLENAMLYNEKLYVKGVADQKEYSKQLNILGNGVMCSLEIPKIDLKLPVCHGTEEEVLSSNIGHLKESSLPIGGESSHCVLSGHRGLPNAELFTRLDELEKGDMFFIVVCNQRLGYKVSQISVVQPDDVECVRIQEGKDLLSLVTCTPYGLNTHRLIVTGERIFEWEVETKDVKVQTVSNRDKIYLLVPIGFIFAILIKKLRKCWPVFVLGLIFLCPMDSFAAGNSIEVQFSENNAEPVLCTKIGEKIDNKYILEKEYQEANVDLNAIKTAKQIQEAANCLCEYAEDSILIPIDQTGYGELHNLENGVYLLKSQKYSKSKMLPTLVFLPTFLGDDIYSTVIMIPKFQIEEQSPDTGWETYENVYFILLMASFIVILVWHLKKYRKP